MRQRATKIVATIGPNTETKTMVRQLIKAGVDIFRFNFKHHTPEVHKNRITLVREVAATLKRPIALLLDLPGPELRTRLQKPLDLKTGDVVHLEKALNDDAWVMTLNYPEMVSFMVIDSRVVVDDGKLTFTVIDEGGRIGLVSEGSGTLESNKTLSVPEVDLPLPSLSETDYLGLELASEHEVDMVALSFIRSSDDVMDLKKAMAEKGVSAQIVSKIETLPALQNLEDILSVSDGVMVARGDMAAEVAYEQVPFYQKEIIAMATRAGCFTITATQMLESMLESPVPSRADVSDIANAAYDQTDAVMLSAETAIGEYPVKAVEVMGQTLLFNEPLFEEDARTRYHFDAVDQEMLIANSAYNLYWQMNLTDKPIAGIVVFAQTARAAQVLSLFRMKLPIYAFCPETMIANQLLAYYGITPIVAPLTKEAQENRVMITGEHVREAVDFLQDRDLVHSNDRLLCVYEDYWHEKPGLTTLKVLVV